MEQRLPGQHPVLRRLFRELNRWCRLWHLPQLPRQIQIEFSSRLKRSLGRCHARQGLVRLNGLLLLKENEALLFEALCHEVAHVAVFRRHGSKPKPHGREWRALLVAAGFKPRTVVEAGHVHGLPALSLKRAILYEYRCPVCNFVHRSRFKSALLRCRSCLQAGRLGMLTVTRLNRSRHSGVLSQSGSTNLEEQLY